MRNIPVSCIGYDPLSEAHWVFRLEAPILVGALRLNTDKEIDVILPEHLLPEIPPEDLMGGLNTLMKELHPVVTPGTMPLSRRAHREKESTHPGFITVYAGRNRVGVLNLIEGKRPCYAEVDYLRIDDEQPFKSYHRFDGERWQKLPLEANKYAAYMAAWLRAHGVMRNRTKLLQLRAEAAAERRLQGGGYSYGKARKYKSLV